MSYREMILATVKDAASKFMYYDRKDDEELPRGAIEAAVLNKEVTIDEIVGAFRTSVERRVEKTR